MEKYHTVSIVYRLEMKVGVGDTIMESQEPGQVPATFIAALLIGILSQSTVAHWDRRSQPLCVFHT